MKEKLQQYLYKLLDLNGSDLHLKAGSAVHMRVNGELLSVGEEVLSNKDILEIAKTMLTSEQHNKLMDTKELDYSYELEKENRFRVNFFYQVNGLSIVLRVIPERILSLEELNLPEIVKKISDLNHGLVLVTGTSGSGKSTTMAAIIDRINKLKRKHIVSIEDPIEYLHKEDKCLISQRSVGINTLSFTNALKSALREDIDVIFIGELRDLETVEIALHAANTGHLVVSTLHTLDAKDTITRMIGMFPKEEQPRIRMTLSFLLEGVISQRLVGTKGNKRIAAIEVMVKTKRISELISESRDSEILEAIIKGKDVYGTQSFDQALFELFRRGIIEKTVALRNATNPSDMSLKLQGIGDSDRHEEMSGEKKKRRNVFDLK